MYVHCTRYGVLVTTLLIIALYLPFLLPTMEDVEEDEL